MIRPNPISLRKLLVLALFVPFFTACNAEPSPSETIARARAELEKGDQRAALIHLKNLLRNDPDQLDGRILLGQTYMELHDPVSAEKELQYALQKGADEDKVLPPLAEAMLYQGKYEEVASIEPQSTLNSHANSALLNTMSKAQMALGKEEAAGELVKSALALDPESPGANTSSAALLAKRDAEAGRAKLEAILKDQPNYAPAWAALGNLERSANNPTAAEKAFTKAIEFDPSGVNYLTRAIVRLELQDLAGTQEDIDLSRKYLPRYFEVDFIQGLLYIKSENINAAKSSLEAALAANSEFIPAKIYLAQVNFNLGNLKQAENLTASYLSKNPDFPEANKLYAAIMLQSARYDEASNAAEFAIDRLPNDIQLYFILANAMHAKGNWQEEINTLNKIQAISPDDPFVLSRLGSAQLAMGEDEAGLALLNLALEKDPAFGPAAKELIEYNAKKENYDAAVKIAESFRLKNPEMPAAQNLAGLAYAAKGDLDSAQAAFDLARKLSPGDPDANHNSAVIALRRNKPELARQHYDEIIKYHPDQLSALIRLAQLDQMDGRITDMIAHLEEAISRNPKAEQPRLLLGAYYLNSGEPSKVPLVITELLQDDNDNPAALQLTGQSQLAIGDFNGATSNFQRLVKVSPQFAEGHFLLSQAYGKSGDTRKSIAQLERTLALNPQHFLAKLSLARIMYKQNNDSRAEELIEELKAISPSNTELQNLAALLAKRSGNEEEALAIFSKAFENEQSTKSAIRLAQQDSDMGNSEVATSRMERWLAEHEDDIVSRLYLAKLYSSENRRAEAIEQYKIVLETNRDNVIILNNLAWEMRNTNPKEALEYATRAQQISHSPEIMDTLAVVLMKNQAYERALSTSDQATSQIKLEDGYPSLFFHKALILEASGKNEEAKNLIELLLTKYQRFPERADAQATLNRLQGNETNNE